MYKLILQSSRQSEPEPDREGGAAGADGCSLHGGLEARGSVRASHRETYPISLDVHRCREEHGLQKTDSWCYISFEKDAWSDSSNRRQAPFIEWWGGGRFGSGVHALVLSLWMERACLVTVAKTGVLDRFCFLFFCINRVVISMPINRGDEVRWARAVARRGTWLEGSWMSRVLSEAPMSPLCWPVCVAYWIWKNCIKNQSFLLVAIC